MILHKIIVGISLIIVVCSSFFLLASPVACAWGGCPAPVFVFLLIIILTSLPAVISWIRYKKLGPYSLFISGVSSFLVVGLTLLLLFFVINQ